MKSRMKRGLTGLAALTAVTAGLVLPAASPAGASSAGTPVAGSMTLNPLTGTSSTTFTAVPPVGTVCPLDSASGGSRWQTFLVPKTVDPVTLTFNISGPIAQGAHPGTYLPLFDTFGTPIVNRTTAAATGLITPLPSYNLSTAPVADGAYWLGFACTVGGNIIDFSAGSLGTTANPSLVGKSATWASPITISGGGTTYAYGAVPSAPTITAVAADGQITGMLTAGTPAADPAVTGYTVTATPTVGSPVSVPVAAAGAFTIPGLVNGTSYSVSAVATNAVGASPVSNVVSPVVPNIAVRPGVTGLTASVTGGGAFDLSWVAPTGPAPTGILVQAAPTVANPAAITPADVTLPAGATSYSYTGLTSGIGYTFTVTPQHTAPYTAAAATTSATSVDTLIFQEITVERPEGALVLTQRCGVYGDLAAETGVDAFPGFPVDLPAAATVAGPGTSPTIPGGGVDPEFGEYPYPAPVTYPTTCGLDLETAALVSSGALAGQYYAADGRLNQVTVVDTRDIDAGWTVNGTVEDFAGSGTAAGETFDGDFLGWTPKVTSTSAGQIVEAGDPVLPGAASGLTSGKVLAETTSHADPASGLGIAELDARIKLLIPATADAGDYSATLSLTAV